MNKEAMRSTLRVTKALADIQRVRVLMMLRDGELCVCQIVAVLELAPSTVSKHLSILDVAGLVRSRKQGRWAYFSLAEDRAGARFAPLFKWLSDNLEDDSVIREDSKRLRQIFKRGPEELCRARGR